MCAVRSQHIVDGHPLPTFVLLYSLPTSCLSRELGGSSLSQKHAFCSCLFFTLRRHLPFFCLGRNCSFRTQLKCHFLHKTFLHHPFEIVACWAVYVTFTLLYISDGCINVPCGMASSSSPQSSAQSLVSVANECREMHLIPR